MRGLLFVITLTLSLFSSLGSTSFGASADVEKCRLTWNLPDVKAGESFFPATLPYVFQPYPSTEVKFDYSGARKQSKWTITEFFGDKGAYYERYEIQCDLNLNCAGSRSIASGSSENNQALTFDPSVFPIGKIGEREIFRLVPKADGFSYRFTEYEIDGESRGMGLECHD